MNLPKYIELRGYRITKDPEGKHTLGTLVYAEDLCEEMCDVVDKGEQWSPSSRYTYTTEYFKETKEGFSIGSAHGAVQYVLIMKLGAKQGDHFKIEKI